MPARSYSALANWDGRFSQSRSTPSGPPSQPSQMPLPPPPSSSSSPRASPSNSRGRTPSGSAPPGSASSTSLQCSAADVAASGMDEPVNTLFTSPRPPAASPNRARPLEVFQSGIFTSDQTRVEVLEKSKVNMAVEIADRPRSSAIGDPLASHSHPSDVPFDSSMFADSHQSPVPHTQLAQGNQSGPQPWFSQHARAPSRVSARSYRSSEDDDENVRRMLLASQPASPVQNKHAFGASSDQFLPHESLPAPPQRPLATYVPHNAAQPPSGLQSPFHWMSDSHLQSMQAAASSSGPRAFATKLVPLANHLDELGYPSSASEGPDLDIQMVSNTSATSEQEAGEASTTVSIEPTAGDDEQKTETPTIDNTSWDTWVASNAARREHNVKATASVPVRAATPVPIVAESEDHFPPSPIQRTKTPLFLPSPTASSSAGLSSRTTPDDETSSQVSDERAQPSRQRSPSVEVIEPSVYSLSTGDSTLVDSDALHRRAPSIRPSPARVADASNVGPLITADNGPAREPSIISISSTSPDPPVRHSETSPGQNHVYIELRKLPPSRKKHYRPLADLPLPEDRGSVGEDHDDEPRAGPSRVPAALSPTVSYYTRTSPGPATPRSSEESDGDVVMLSRAPSPRVVPSSVSPPARRTQRSPDGHLSLLSPLPPGVPPIRPPAARHRESTRPGPSRRPRTPSPEPERESEPDDGEGQHWAFDLSAAYNRAHDLAVVADDAAPPRKRKRRRESVAAHEARGRAAGRTRRARRIAESSDSSEALPSPKRRKTKAAVEGGPAAVQAPPASATGPSASSAMQSPPAGILTPSSSALQKRHSQLHTPDVVPSSDGSHGERWVLQGLGDDALDPLAELCGAVPIALVSDFEAGVQSDHARELDPARAMLPMQLRHVFAALGIAAPTIRQGQAATRVVLQELDVPLVVASKGKGHALGSADEEVRLRTPEARLPVTPPRTIQPGTVVPSRPSVVSMKDARERRQKEYPPSPSPPEIVRQPVVTPPAPQVVRASQEDMPSVYASHRHGSHAEQQPSSRMPATPPSVAIQQPPAVPVFPSEQDVPPSQSFSYAYQQKQTHYNEILQADALRGQDAFLGVIQDDCMEIDDRGGYPSYEHHPSSLALSSQWMDPSQPLPPQYSTLHEGMVMAMNEMSATGDPALGIDPQIFAQGGVATIDPSLLGGPMTPPRARSPTVTPSPPSASPHSTADSDGDRDWSPRHSSPGSHSRSRPGPASATNKSKGKGRAADVGYRARAAQSRVDVLDSCDQDETLGGKRKRKPSARAVEAGYRTVDDQPATRKGNRADGRSGSRLIDVDIAALAREVPYCHQCRGKNAYEKMRCTVIKDTGLPCGVRYCEKCIVTRYPDMEFNSMSTTFKCPRCLGFCNCTHCARGRGEEYVSSSDKHRRYSFAVSALYAESLRKEKEEKAAVSKAKEARKRRSTSAAGSAAPPSTSLLRRSVSAVAGHNPKAKTAKKPIAPTPQELEMAAKMALPQGAVWGTIYGLNNDRIGVGIVADDASQKIMVTRPPELIGGGDDPRLTWPSSSSNAETEDDSEVDQLMSTTPADSRMSTATSARAVSAAPAAGASVDEASSSRPPAPPRTRGHYIGKLQRGWTRLPLGKGSEKGLVRMRGLPAVHAYVGSRAVIRRSTAVLGGDDDGLGDDADDADSGRFECISGELTPDMSEDENRGAHAPSGAPGVQSPSQRPPPGGEDLGFILARVIKAISQPPQDGLSSQAAAPQSGSVDTTVTTARVERPDVDVGDASAGDGRVSGITTVNHAESAADASSRSCNAGGAPLVPESAAATLVKVFPEGVPDTALLAPQNPAEEPGRSATALAPVDGPPPHEDHPALGRVPGSEHARPSAPNSSGPSGIPTGLPSPSQSPLRLSQKPLMEYHEPTTSWSG